MQFGERIVNATEAVTASCAFARNVAGLARVVALIDPRNVASQRVATKAGLRYERDVTVPTKTLRVYGIAWRAAAASAGSGDCA